MRDPERYFIIALVFILASLFFGVVESAADEIPKEEGMEDYYCSTPPPNTAAICCEDKGGHYCESITSKYDNTVCWCECLEGLPMCSCEEPRKADDGAWISYLLYMSRNTRVQI